MKMFLGKTPIQSLNVKHFEMDTNSATVQPSDLQAGVTCYARGVKVTGTGKAFEFANYGVTTTNIPNFIPVLVNVVEIASLEHPIKTLISFPAMVNVDFATEQTIGTVVIDSVEYPITVKVENHILTFNCEKEVSLNFFYGKDNYI